MTAPVPLAPPRGFRGSFSTGPSTRDRFAGASGPIRIQPSAVACPTSADDVSHLVEWADHHGVSLVPRGGGTGMPGGNVGEGVSVDMVRHMDRLGTVDRESRTIAAGAGVTLDRIEEAAQEAGLFFPPLPSSAARCTVGGVLANNSAGVRSFRHGSVRDWIVGATVVLADGRQVRLDHTATGTEPFAALHRALAGAGLDGWPEVTKNASGYALDRFIPTASPLSLLIGSEGTLGLVVDATLRLEPAPADEAVALLAVRALDDVATVAAAARTLGARACEFFGRRFIELTGPRMSVPLPDDAEALVLVELAGTRDATRAAAESLRALARAMDATLELAREPEARTALWSVRRGASPAIAEAAARGLVSTQFIEDSVVPPARLPEYVRGVESILDRVGLDRVVFGHAGDGNVHVNPLVPVDVPDWRPRVRRALEATVDLVARLGGTLSGEHGDGRLRAPYLDRIWTRDSVRAFRLVKERLDPANLLNPGVILPLPGQDPLDGLGAAWPAPGLERGVPA